MAIPVTFKGIETKTFDPLPIGRYACKVSGVTYNEASNASNEPYLAWEFTVSEGEFSGRKAFLNSSLQAEDKAAGKKDARWATMRILEALGLSKEEIQSKEWDFEDPEVLDQLMDRECIVSIGHQMYEGEKRQRVRRVLNVKGESKDGSPF